MWEREVPCGWNMVIEARTNAFKGLDNRMRPRIEVWDARQQG